jgi:glycerol kinase
VFGESSGVITDRAIPVAGIAGDQHAALFGQACFERGMTKNTYGTGSFMLMQTGTEPVPSTNGLLTTPAWGIGGGAEYALEGSVFVTGAAIQWLRDGLRLIDYAAETEQLALSIADSGGVYVVPAFVGLGAPHWDMDARGTIVGLTGGAGREHIVRATLESIAYQTADVLRAMESDAGVAIPTLRVDGGGTANGFLMQFQSDILDRPIEVAAVQETTARGAAYLAGLATGAWRSTDEITAAWKPARRFEPSMSPGQRALLVDGWRRAVERAKGWANPE